MLNQFSIEETSFPLSLHSPSFVTYDDDMMAVKKLAVLSIGNTFIFQLYCQEKLIRLIVNQNVVSLFSMFKYLVPTQPPVLC